MNTDTDFCPLWMIAQRDTPAYGMTRLAFSYETTVDGTPWLADVDDAHMYEPDTFAVDPDPCGMGFRDTEARAAYLADRDAVEIGWVDPVAGTLHISRDVTVEDGWSGFPLTATSFDVIHANAGARRG